MSQSLKKAKVIALINEKGGVGKTQVAVQIAFVIASTGSKVLVIDNDSSFDATTAFTLGQIPDAISKIYRPEGTANTVNLYSQDMLAIPVNVAPGIDLFGAHESLINVTGDDAIWAFVDSVEKFAHEYDFILIDCPPSIGAQMSAAMRASDALLIPCLADMLSYNAVIKILTRVKAAQRRETKAAKVLGIFINKLKKPLSNSGKEVLEIFEASFGCMFMKHVDGRPIALADTVKQSEALSQGKSVLETAPSSNAAVEMAEFIKDLYSRLANLDALNDDYKEFSKGRSF